MVIPRSSVDASVVRPKRLCREPAPAGVRGPNVQNRCAAVRLTLQWDGFGDGDGVLWAGWGATAVADTGYSGTSGGVVVLGRRLGNMGYYLPVEVSFSVERGRILVVFVVEAN